MEIFRTNSVADSQTYVDNCLDTHHEGCVIHTSDKICILTGKLPTYDIDTVNKYKYEVGIGRYLGGTIVCFPGDVSVCITTRGSTPIASNIVKASMAYLLSKGIDSKLERNDVLVEGTKVISWGRASISGYSQSVIHYSIGSMDLDLVNEICTKPRIKIPGSLGIYGITTEEIINYITSMIMNYKV